jgi:CelD/BcsL family acetyltransferase involved in cellulose biosynthesis
MVHSSGLGGIGHRARFAQPPLSATVLRTADELTALAPEWATLWARVPAATPFQAPAWLLPWWRTLGGGDLVVVAVRDDQGCLVGLAPFFIYVDGSVRRLMPIGIGISDYLDILLDPTMEDAAAAALFACLRQERDRWDVIAFEELNPGARLLTVPCPPGWLDDVDDQGSCMVLTLPEGTGRIEDCVRRSKLYDVRRARDRARRRGTVSLTRADPSSVGEQLEALLRLHGMRWASRGEPGGVLASAKLRDFHRQVAPAMLAAGGLRLYALRMNGQIIGSYYGFLHRTQAYAYLMGFDPAYAFESPGTILLAHAIEEAMREGAREFHMLRGREPYKYAWGATERPNRRRCFRLADAGHAL